MADDLSKRLAGLTPEQRELLLRRLKKEGLAVPGENPAPAEQSASSLFSLDPGPEPEPSDRPIDFSLFFFSDGGAKSPAESYDLLLESARFADRHGFAAIWTPERHFPGIARERLTWQPEGATEPFFLELDPLFTAP